MPRKLKPYKVGEVHFKDGSLPMMLDRESALFFVEIQGECVSAATADECRTKAREAWSRLTTLEWKKVLVIETPGGWRIQNSSTEVYFRHSVHEIAQSLTGVWFERNRPGGGFRVVVGDPKEDHLDRYNGPTKTNPQQGDYVLPWSPALEAACEEIERRIVKLREHIEDLLGRPDAPEILEAAVGRLLPAPKKED